MSSPAQSETGEHARRDLNSVEINGNAIQPLRVDQVLLALQQLPEANLTDEAKISRILRLLWYLREQKEFAKFIQELVFGMSDALRTKMEEYFSAQGMIVSAETKYLTEALFLEELQQTSTVSGLYKVLQDYVSQFNQDAARTPRATEFLVQIRRAIELLTPFIKARATAQADQDHRWWQDDDKWWLREELVFAGQQVRQDPVITHPKLQQKIHEVIVPMPEAARKVYEFQKKMNSMTDIEKFIADLKDLPELETLAMLGVRPKLAGQMEILRGNVVSWLKVQWNGATLRNYPEKLGYLAHQFGVSLTAKKAQQQREQLVKLSLQLLEQDWQMRVFSEARKRLESGYAFAELKDIAACLSAVGLTDQAQAVMGLKGVAVGELVRQWGGLRTRSEDGLREELVNRGITDERVIVAVVKYLKRKNQEDE
jgi:hypothetical protein